MQKLAINGGEPIRTAPWPSWPMFGDEERTRLLEVFESGKWWYGETVREFEEKFAAFQDARFGITCTSGTTGLEASLVGLGIGAGDEVIIPPYTFVATATSVMHTGAKPVFADVGLDTLNLDPDETEKAITPRTKAVIPVHFAGLPSDMDRLSEIADKHGIRILEDACHSWGTKWKGKGTGALGDCGAFSFQMSKNITAGEGGIILTDNESLADTIRSYTHVGRRKGGEWYAHYSAGSNLRITELQAAILLGQLTRLEEHTERREKNAAILDEKIDALPGLNRQPRDERITRRSYHLYTIRIDTDELGVSGDDFRNRFVEAMQAEGIQCASGYPHPLYANPLFAGADIENVFCPNAEKLADQIVWLHHTVLLAEESDMMDIANALEKVIGQKGSL